MTNYRFVTTWRIEAPLQTVCEAICYSMNWPHWWSNVERVEEIAPCDAQGIGGVRRYTWRGTLPYRLTFDIRVIRFEPLSVIEGVASGDQLSAVQSAFLECGGAQCGICTPGMVIAAMALLARHPHPGDAEIREGLAGNLCRCTGYQKIFAAAVRACITAAEKPAERG